MNHLSPSIFVHCSSNDGKNVLLNLTRRRNACTALAWMASSQAMTEAVLTRQVVADVFSPGESSFGGELTYGY